MLMYFCYDMNILLLGGIYTAILITMCRQGYADIQAMNTVKQGMGCCLYGDTMTAET